MAWFSVWLPLVSQLVVPVSLLAWLAFGRHATKARTIVGHRARGDVRRRHRDRRPLAGDPLVAPLRLRRGGCVDHRASVTWQVIVSRHDRRSSRGSR